jgi:hypothetical protein|tara:strand:+ start:3615 stop:3869 length:255 start_codon:yes stop_codon:yes gene_type:complete
MLNLLGLLFWTTITILVMAAALRMYMRRKELFSSDVPVLDENAIQTILEIGEISTDEDEPLDLEEIDEEEERFWRESWDEPEEL